jgi:putative ABC transport system substrate-binding protein
MTICLRRREFIAGLGSPVSWPLAAGAQQSDRVRRIGVLIAIDENDPAMKLRYSAFTQALADLGWIDGRNVRIDLRSGGGDGNRIGSTSLKVRRTHRDNLYPRTCECPTPVVECSTG